MSLLRDRRDRERARRAMRVEHSLAGGRSGLPALVAPTRQGGRGAPAAVYVPEDGTVASNDGRYVRLEIPGGEAVGALAFGEALQDAGWGHAPGSALVIPVGQSYYDLRECRLIVNQRGDVDVWLEVNGERLWPADADLDAVWLGGDGVSLFLEGTTGPVSEADEVTVRFDPPIEIVKGRAVMQLVDRQKAQATEPVPEVPPMWDSEGNGRIRALNPDSRSTQVPPDTEPGDLLLAAFYLDGRPGALEGDAWWGLWMTLDEDPGFGLIDAFEDGDYKVYLYSKTAAAGDAGATVTWSFSELTYTACTVWRFPAPLQVQGVSRTLFQHVGEDLPQTLSVPGPGKLIVGLQGPSTGSGTHQPAGPWANVTAWDYQTVRSNGARVTAVADDANAVCWVEIERGSSQLLDDGARIVAWRLELS